MIGNVTPVTRRKLVEYRCKAMQGDLEVIAPELEAHAQATLAAGRAADGLALSMLFTELLHLDDQDAKSAVYFDGTIVAHLAGQSPELNIIADYNRAQLDMALWRPMPYYPSLMERAREIGLDLFDTKQLFYADEDALLSKHYDALPRFWREFLRTYRQGCWHVSYWAAGRLAREYLQIGDPQSAAWFSVYALDEKAAREAGKALLDHRDGAAIRSCVRRLLTNANLRAHFSIACEVIIAVSDVIPDDTIEATAIWLFPHCGSPTSARLGAGSLSMAWKALGKIGSRLSPDTARQAVRTAVCHPLWNAIISDPDQGVRERQDIVKALQMVVSALPAEDMESLAEHAIPLATARVSNQDYYEVVDLLCKIADKGSRELRLKMGDKLYIQGKHGTFLLGQVAQLFGKTFLPPDRLENAADQVIGMIRLQVQRLKSGEEPKEYPGKPITYTAPFNDGRIVVSMPSGIELEAMARQRHDLSPEKVNGLVEAILDALTDRENFLGNRAALVKALATFADSLADQLSDRVCSILEPMARGEIEEPTTLAPSSEGNNPLSRFRINMDGPSDLRGAALVTLAQLERTRQNCTKGRLQALLEDSLADFDPDVRRKAFIAAQILPELSEPSVMAVLQGLRDQDPNSAAAAFYVLVHSEQTKLTRSQWSLFLYATKMATQNTSINLRAAAASAVARLAPSAPTVSIKRRVVELQRMFSADVSFTVRKNCTHHEAAELS